MKTAACLLLVVVYLTFISQRWTMSNVPHSFRRYRGGIDRSVIDLRCSLCCCSLRACRARPRRAPVCPPTSPPVRARDRVHRVYCDTADSGTRPRHARTPRQANSVTSTSSSRTASPAIGRRPLHLCLRLAACYQPPDGSRVCFRVFFCVFGSAQLKRRLRADTEPQHRASRSR